MKRLFLALSVFAIAIIVVGARPFSSAKAAEPTISFPISELGNCASKAACREYCNDREHMAACTAYGKTHSLITKEQAERNEKFEQKLRVGGPGKCASVRACVEFCKNKEHAEECRAFAEKIGVALKPLLRRIASSTASSSAGMVRERERERQDDASSTESGRRILPQPKPIEREATSTGSEVRGRGGAPINPPVCPDQETCRKICSDPNGQFFEYSDCVQFRRALRELQSLQEGDVPPNPADLPTDNACPDGVTCAARCMNDDSPYFLKPECIKFREENPVGYVPSPTRVLLGNMLQNFIEFFK